MMTKGKLLGLLLVSALAIVLLVVGCGGGTTTTMTATATTTQTATATATTTQTATATTPATTTPSTGPQYGGTLIRINAFKPAGTEIGIPWALGLGTPEYFYPCIDLLIELDKDGNILPRLASSWEVAPDKSSITFKLKSGVKFSDGTDFNAEAAKFTLDNQIANHGVGTSQYESVDAVDNLTLRINLKNYTNTIFATLAQPASNQGFISPTAYQQNGADWATDHPVGTGPFKLVSFDRDVGALYERNDNYFQQGRPYLDGYEFKFISDPLAASMVFRQGGGHVLNLFRAQQMKLKSELVESGYLPAYFAGGPGMYVMIPDSKNASSPLSNPKVREALDYGVNKETIATTLGFNLWKAAYQAAPEANAAYNPNIVPRMYDPEKAKQLLAEAGYSNNLTLNIYGTSGDAVLSTAIQSMLKDIGVTLNIQTVDQAKFSDLTFNGWTNGFMLTAMARNINWMATIDRYYEASTGQYVSVMRSDAFNNALVAAETAVETADWTAKSEQLIKIMADEAMIIPLFEHEPDIFIAATTHDIGFNGGQHGWWNSVNGWIEH